MTQYIDKDALVAEVERRKAINEKAYMQAFLNSNDNRDSFGYKVQEDIDILSSINTLKVKEIDLEKELENLIEKEKAFVTDNREVKYYNGDSFNHIYELEFIAKHFFELGLKAQKGEKV